MSSIATNVAVRAQPLRQGGMDWQRRSVFAAIFTLLTLTLPACGKPMKKPDILLNPQATMRYELTLTVQDAPGPFESVTAYANYETDADCVPAAPITAGNYGSKSPVRYSVLVAFNAVETNTYQGTMYMDLLKDEDYFGLGVCRWHLTSFSVPMKSGKVTFSTAIVADEIASGQAKVEYFPKRLYGDNSIPDTHVPSLPTNHIATRARADFFSTTLTAKEHFE